MNKGSKSQLPLTEPSTWESHPRAFKMLDRKKAVVHSLIAPVDIWWTCKLCTEWLSPAPGPKHIPQGCSRAAAPTQILMLPGQISSPFWSLLPCTSVLGSGKVCQATGEILWWRPMQARASSFGTLSLWGNLPSVPPGKQQYPKPQPVAPTGASQAMPHLALELLSTPVWGRRLYPGGCPSAVPVGGGGEKAVHSHGLGPSQHWTPVIPIPQSLFQHREVGTQGLPGKLIFLLPHSPHNLWLQSLVNSAWMTYFLVSFVC